jgi:hypothetical protein
VPTICHRFRCEMVGTLRFAHPTKFLKGRVKQDDPACGQAGRRHHEPW